LEKIVKTDKQKFQNSKKSQGKGEDGDSHSQGMIWARVIMGGRKEQPSKAKRSGC